MAPTMAPSTTNVHHVATIACKADAQKAAADHVSAYQAEIDAAFFDSRENRAIRAIMNTNRAPFL